MCHHHLEDKLFEDLPLVLAQWTPEHLDSLAESEIQHWEGRTWQHFSICGDELFFVGMGRAVVEQEHGFGFKTHLS